MNQVETENAADNNTEKSVDPLPEGKALTVPIPVELGREFKHRILLLEDSTFDELPRHLFEMFANIASSRLSKTDILAAFVYIVALESGFIPIDSPKSESYKFNWGSPFNIKVIEDLGTTLPAGYWDSDICSYRVDIELFGLPVQRCQLLARETSDSLCITLNWKTLVGRSVYLPASRYILKSNAKQQLAKYFQNLSELSYKLKQTLFWPMRTTILEDNGNCYCGLKGIPFEVLWSILDRLTSKELQNLSQTCIDLRAKIFQYVEKSHRNVHESNRARLVI